VKDRGPLRRPVLLAKVRETDGWREKGEPWWTEIHRCTAEMKSAGRWHFDEQEWRRLIVAYGKTPLPPYYATMTVENVQEAWRMGWRPNARENAFEAIIRIKNEREAAKRGSTAQFSRRARREA